MRLVYGHSDEIAEWVAQRIDGASRGFGECQAVGVATDRIVAGVVFHNWSPETQVIEVSSAAESPKWAQRRILAELFAYPFEGLGCRMVVARISERNARARRLWRAFGADEYVIPDLRADGEAECVATLTRAQWYGSRLYNGKTKATKAA